MDLKLLDFQNFHPVHNVITIDKNTLLMRGYDPQYPPVSDRPAYFTSEIGIAKSYAKPTLGYFRTTFELKLYDLRYIRLLLKDFFDYQDRSIINNPDITNCIYTITLALGLCSYEKQLDLLRTRYAEELTNPTSHSSIAMENMISYIQNQSIQCNPVEPQGVRIAETTNDNLMIMCLREIFGDSIHGYIMPSVHSPYHYEKTNNMLNSEIVLFNPLECKIELLNMSDQSLPNVIKMNIANLYPPYRTLVLNYKTLRPTKTAVIGGGQESMNKNRFFDAGGKEYDKLHKYVVSAMKKLTKHKKQMATRILMSGGDDSSVVTPAPTQNISPWC